MMLQAILLDRDGVINRERADYVKSWAEMEILPGVLPALACLTALDVPILVLTNQSAIGRGLVSRTQVDAIHSQLQQLVRDREGRIDAFYLCPHHPRDGCACRKPKPGLLLQAAVDFRLNLRDCVFIGDSWTDYQAAAAVDCPSILVASGRQGSQLPSLLASLAAVPLVPDLAAAVSLLRQSPAQLAGSPIDKPNR